jgi:transcriptional regulator with XRE-family HTH domain
MKNKNNKKIDKLQAIRQHPAYKKAFDAAGVRIKLAIEISEARAKKGLSQQELAKIAETTQKVVSKIESGDMNIGLDLLRRIVRCLGLEFRIGAMVLVAGSAGDDNVGTRLYTVDEYIKFSASSHQTKTEHKEYEQA